MDRGRNREATDLLIISVLERIKNKHTMSQELSSDHKRKAVEESEVAINGDDRKPKKNKNPRSSLDSMTLSQIASIFAAATATAAATAPVNNRRKSIPRRSDDFAVPFHPRNNRHLKLEATLELLVSQQSRNDRKCEATVALEDTTTNTAASSSQAVPSGNVPFMEGPTSVLQQQPAPTGKRGNVLAVEPLPPKTAQPQTDGAKGSSKV